MATGNVVVAIDTETTGRGKGERPPRRDGVVQVGYAWRDASGRVRSWHTNCNPGQEFLDGGRALEALRVNGLTERQILAAEPAARVAVEVAEHLRLIEAESGMNVELRAYNREFDESFLRHEPWGLSARAWGRCIMKAAAVHLDGPYGKWPKLQEAVRRLGLPWPDGAAHNAEVDSHAALLVDEILRRNGR